MRTISTNGPVIEFRDVLYVLPNGQMLLAKPEFASAERRDFGFTGTQRLRQNHHTQADQSSPETRAAAKYA